MTSRRWMRLVDLGVVCAALAVDLAVWGGERGTRTGEVVAGWIIPVGAAAVFATLLLRRRFAVRVFALQWLWALSGLVVPGYESFAGLLVALHAVARRTPTGTAVVALAGCSVPFSIDAYDVSLRAPGQRLLSFLVSGAIWMVLTGGVWALGRVAFRSDRRAEEAHRAHQQATAQLLQDERGRIAHELHDSVANAVTAMIVHTAGARGLLTGPDARVTERLSVVEAAGVQAMNELHRLLRLLQPTDPPVEVERRPGPETAPQSIRDLDAAFEQGRAAGLQVRTSTTGVPMTLDPSVDLAACRVVQEGLTNCVKHAGPGAVVTVRLRWTPDELMITVQDDGGSRAGPEPSLAGRLPVLSGGFGLRGLTERVRLVGGRLESAAGPEGFRLSVWLPAVPAPGLLSEPLVNR